MSAIERRRGELRRGPGRTLRGTVMQYGDVAEIPGIGRERFAMFSFADYLRSGADSRLNVMHDRALTVASRRAGSLLLMDSPAELRMVAELPKNDAMDSVLELVGDGLTRGLSVEFHALRERRHGGLRTIHEAALPGLGIVDSPAYTGSGVEVRVSRKFVRGAMPGWQTIAACRCQGRDCDSVSFDVGAFDESLADPNREILAVAGNYDAPVASRRRGTLRLTVRDDALRVELLLPDTDGGKAIADAASVAPLYVRPYLDLDRSEYADEGEPGFKTRRFSRAWLRAIIVGATDAADGLTEAEIVERRGIVTPATPARRRLWL